MAPLHSEKLWAASSPAWYCRNKATIWSFFKTGSLDVSKQHFSMWKYISPTLAIFCLSVRLLRNMPYYGPFTFWKIVLFPRLHKKIAHFGPNRNYQLPSSDQYSLPETGRQHFRCDWKNAAVHSVQDAGYSEWAVHGLYTISRSCWMNWNRCSKNSCENCALLITKKRMEKHL